jgi:hypothetical protein
MQYCYPFQNVQTVITVFSYVKTSFDVMVYDSITFHYYHFSSIKYRLARWNANMFCRYFLHYNPPYLKPITIVTISYCTIRII